MPDHEELSEEIALGCNILQLEGHEHFFLGHVSSRLTQGGYLIKANGLGLGETSAGDTVRVDNEGKTDETQRLHSEAPIHTEIYRSRPDVGSVVHTHHPSIAALTATDVGLEMVSQDSVYFWQKHSTFNSAAMITDAAAGADLATALGPRRAVLLRNHGLVTVGSNIQEAVILAVALGRSATTQIRASSVGAIQPIPDEDLKALSASFEASYHARIESLWNYLTRLLKD